MVMEKFEGRKDHTIVQPYIQVYGAENKKLNNIKKNKGKKYRKSVIGKGVNFCSTDYNIKHSNIPDTAHAFTTTANYLQGNQSCERQNNNDFISNFARNGPCNINSYLSAKERRCIKQVSTPDACKRSSPSHLYQNLRKDPDSSNRVRSNLGSANNSFINPALKSAGCTDSKCIQNNKNKLKERT